jgi:predicted nucleic acid-binding protein
VILVDTSVWIDHLRRTEPWLVELLEHGEVLMHPMIIGELACGSIPHRDGVLGLMRRLPFAPEATHGEALRLVEAHRLMNRGIGYIDVHLLASALLAQDARIWATDAPLRSVASRLFVSYDPAG